MKSNQLVANRFGHEYPRLLRKSGKHPWRRVPQVGFTQLATAEDMRRYGVSNSPDLEPEYGFGPPDGPRRPLLAA